MTKRRMIVLSIVLLLLGGHPARAQQSPLQGFDDYVNRALSVWEVPGVAIAIVKDDRIVLAKGYGVRKLGDPAPVNERTLFAIGSSSKAFTAAALALLVDEGKIKWDDPVVKHLPGFQLYDPYVTRELTVRDLLCHRSGLERGDALWYGTSYDRAEILRRVRYLKPSWSFRSTYGYQNIMFLAAGQIIPAVTGLSWDDFVKQRLFTPLGMSSSVTSTLPLRNADNVASPHAKLDDKVVPIPWRNLDNVGPAGSINSSAIEMAEWVRLHLKEGKHNDRQLISSRAMQEMHAAQMAMRLEKWLESPSPVNHMMVPGTHLISYGLGWFLQDYRGRKVIHHGGSIDGMRAMVGMIPEERLGVVVLTNLHNSSLIVPLVFKVFDSYLGAQPRDWSAEILAGVRSLEEKGRAAQKKIEEAQVKGTSPTLALEKYAGVYQNEMYGEAKVSLDNNRLSLQMLGDTGALDHWNYDTFQVTAQDRIRGKTFVMFVLDAQGKVDELKVPGFVSFKRVPDKGDSTGKP